MATTETKKPATFNISKENLAWLEDGCKNRSKYVDRLITKAREADANGGNK